MISKYRPQAAIYAFTPNATVAQPHQPLLGCASMKCVPALSAEQMVIVAEKETIKPPRA